MSGHYFGSVWYFLAAAAIIAIGWCTTNASGGIGPHGTNLPWVQKPIGASFGVCGGAGTGSARMCELSFLEFDCPGCAAMQENPRVVRQPALSWVYVGEGSCWACVVKLFEGWCFLLENYCCHIVKWCICWRPRMTIKAGRTRIWQWICEMSASVHCGFLVLAETENMPSRMHTRCSSQVNMICQVGQRCSSEGLRWDFAMTFSVEVWIPDVCFSSLNSLRKWPKRKLVSIMIAAVKEAFSKSLQHLRTLDDDKRHMDRNSGSGCLKILMFGSGPKLLLGYEGWCGAWHGMLVDCVTLPVLSGSVLSMHLAWSSRLWEKVFCDSGFMTVLPSDIFKHRLCHWSLLEAGHCWCL